MVYISKRKPSHYDMYRDDYKEFLGILNSIKANTKEEWLHEFTRMVNKGYFPDQILDWVIKGVTHGSEFIYSTLGPTGKDVLLEIGMTTPHDKRPRSRIGDYMRSKKRRKTGSPTAEEKSVLDRDWETSLPVGPKVL